MTRKLALSLHITKFLIAAVFSVNACQAFAQTVLPPMRPAHLKTPELSNLQKPDVQKLQDPVVLSAVSQPTIVTEALALERANAYFNRFETLSGTFSQISGDGRKTTGRLYVQRPGRLRFDYDSPSPLEIIADGKSVAVRDRKLVTQDLYILSQTPLKFLVQDRIDLKKDVILNAVKVETDAVAFQLEDRSTLGGTSKITLIFDSQVQALKRWHIVDPQGFDTNVQLSDLQINKKLDQKLFAINYERLLETNR